jgi:hypothetical protein
MQEYYTFSLLLNTSSNPPSSAQRTFNDSLVTVVRQAVSDLGWTLDPTVFFNDRIFRDRILCYYKTLVQNARKRIKTMRANPTKKMNARNLVQHLDLLSSTYHEQQTSATTAGMTTTMKMKMKAPPQVARKEPAHKASPVCARASPREGRQ